MTASDVLNDDAFMFAAASVLGIPLDPAWHSSIRFHLQLSLRMAAMVQAFTLADDAEPAPVYRV